MTLRQQLMLKRALRNLRTWAPPISLGVIIGVLFFFAAEHFDRASAEPQLATISYASPPPPERQAGVLRSAQIERRRHPIESYDIAAFRNCSAARAAGAAPVYAGEPGYGAHLDRDNDGIGCEPYRNASKR